MADERRLDAPSPGPGVADPLEALGDARFISVTTFRRSGEGVATPVEFVARDGAIYVRTLADSGKVKRIRNNARVRVAACSIRGKLRGPSFDGVASLPGDDATNMVYPLFAAKYGLLWQLAIKLRKPRTQVVKIVPREASAP